MMKKLMHRVRLLVDLERKQAGKDNGQRFHSVHEGYGVLLEEMMEARLEHEAATNTAGALLMAIHQNGQRRIHGLTSDLEQQATRAAAEYIQVAAMARKMREGLVVRQEEDTP